MFLHIYNLAVVLLCYVILQNNVKKIHLFVIKIILLANPYDEKLKKKGATFDEGISISTSLYICYYKKVLSKLPYRVAKLSD